MGATEMVKRDCTDGGDRNSPFSNKCIPTGAAVPAATSLRMGSLRVLTCFTFVVLSPIYRSSKFSKSNS